MPSATMNLGLQVLFVALFALLAAGTHPALAQEKQGGSQGIGVQSTFSPTGKATPAPSSDEFDAGLKALREKLNAKSQAKPEPKKKTVKEDEKESAPFSDWAGNWEAEVTIFESPEGPSSQVGRVIIYISPDQTRGTCNPSGSPPLPCSVTVNGQKVSMHGIMQMRNGDVMHLNAYLQKKSMDTASILVKTRLVKAGITSAAKGKAWR
jgi:hypothetical protein